VYVQEQAEAHDEMLNRYSRRVRTLYQCNGALFQAESEHELLQSICDILAAEDEIRLAWIGYCESDAEKTVRPVAQAGFGLDYLERVKISWGEETETGQGPFGIAVRTGTACWVDDIRTDPRFAPWRVAALAHGCASCLAVPLIGYGKPGGAVNLRGTLNLYSAERDAFDGHTREHYTCLATSLAFAVTALRGHLAEQLTSGVATLRASDERKRAQVELQRSEAYLAEAQRLSHTGSWAWDVVRRGHIHKSLEYCRMFELDQGDPASFQVFRDRIHPEDGPRVDEEWERAIRDKADVEAEYRVVLPEGGIRHLYSVGHPIVNASGEVVELVGTVMDVTERKRAERAVRRARERTLEARFTAMLEERTRLAREIHDTLLQGFTGVALQLVAATSRVAGPPEAVATLRELVGLAHQTLEDARRSVWDMRAPALAGGDFPATLRATTEDGLRGTGLALECTVGGVPRSLDPAVEAVVFRVAQEAIANVVKHAAARTVRLGLAYGARGVRLSVSDDGRGFMVDPDFRAYGGHWGLLGMHERASQVRAKLAVRSAVGQGTEVILVAPYWRHERSDPRPNRRSPQPSQSH
jgi:signal transduction histidine kinase